MVKHKNLTVKNIDKFDKRFSILLKFDHSRLTV